MPSNVEIKAKVRNVEKLKTLLIDYGDKYEISDTVLCTPLSQKDNFFTSKNGRLKLREFGDGTADLIWYERADSIGPKKSQYSICKLWSQDIIHNMFEVLSNANGVVKVVEKTRLVYMKSQTRIHVDTVKGLGDFMELEVVLNEGQTVEEGVEIAKRIMKDLGIAEEDLVQGAYVDML